MLDKSEMIFGVRAVIEALQAGKEIDKILVKSTGRICCFFMSDLNRGVYKNVTFLCIVKSINE